MLINFLFNDIMSSWQDHLRDYKKSHPKLSLKDAMKGASATYVKGSGAKKQKGGRKLTALEKKQMFPNGVPNMGPFTPNIDGDNWEERDIPNEIKRTFEGMKKTWQDDPLGLVKYAKKVPVIGEAADKVFGGGSNKPKKTIMAF